MAQSETCKYFVTESLDRAAQRSRYVVFRATILNSTFLSKAMTLRVLSTLCTAAFIALLVACGGDPKSQPVPITVTFDPNFPPPASLNTSSSVGIAAVVTNDNRNAGVNFTCTPTGTCGTFSPTGTGSGVPVCYVAPAQVPTGGTATVTATSVTDPTKFKSATITIVAGLPNNPC
jgi:hypothetical protein